MTLNNPRIVVLHELEEEMTARGVDLTRMDQFILETIEGDSNLTPTSTVQAVVKIEHWKRPKQK